jgi:hypothetical protein
VLTDDTGVIQHAVENVPERSTGYCTDDVARAFIVALQYLELEKEVPAAERLASTYLAFLRYAQRDDGWFHNFMSYGRGWLDEIGSHDANGRAMWALGFGLRYAPDERWRRLCLRMLERQLPTVDGLGYLRSKAYASLGLAHALESGAGDSSSFQKALGRLAADLRAVYQTCRSDDWEWFEDFMTYDNARLCEALLRTGVALNDEASAAAGLRTFSFFVSTTVEHGVYVPIGNRGWYPRGGVRARYAQQPLEAAALVDAAHAAFEAGGDPAHAAAALIGLEWFLGRNTLSISLASSDGGCSDGLEEEGTSRNMGAESTLAYLSSSCAVALRRAAPLRVAR